MIRSLSTAATQAKERISTMENGKFNIVGFIEPDNSDSDSNGWRSPSPDQEKRDRKRKGREDDDESRAASRHRRE